jgi:hypothetical protein
MELEKVEREGVDWINLAQDGLVAGRFEHGIELWVTL